MIALSLLSAWPSSQSSSSKKVGLVVAGNRLQVPHRQQPSTAASSLGHFSACGSVEPCHIRCANDAHKNSRRRRRRRRVHHHYDGVSSSSSYLLLNLRCGSADCDDDTSRDSHVQGEANINVGTTDDDPASQHAMMVEVVGSNDFSDTPTLNDEAVTASDGAGDDEVEAFAHIVMSEHDEELDDRNLSDVIVDTDDDCTKGVSVRSDGNSRSISTPPTLPSFGATLASKKLAASDRRASGKMLHDSGKLKDAAVAFREAALLLDEAILLATELSMDDSTAEDDATSSLSDISTTNNELSNMAVERATCRLHEALCLLKDGRPDQCIAACTDVLQDGATVISPPLSNEEIDDEDSNQSMIEITTIPFSGATGSFKASHAKLSHQLRNTMLPSQIRARAHHRRAKARLALEDLDGAYEDARCAAFLGDRNAVQFYGRLMREGSRVADLSEYPGRLSFSGLSESSSSRGGEKTTSPEVMANVFSSSLFNSPPSGVTRSTSKSNNGGDESFFNSLIFNMLAQPSSGSEGGLGRRRRAKKSKKGSSSKDSSAKSLLNSLLKGVEDEGTQRSICNYLHSTSTQQVMQYASLAGMPVKEDTARRLVDIAHGVTPKGIRKSVSYVKVGYFIFNTIRKTLKLINNYKPFIVLIVFLLWFRSAIVEPCLTSNKTAKTILQQTAGV